MKDLRIEFKVKNAVLYRALQEFARVHGIAGWGEKDLNLSEVSRYTGLDYNELIGYLSLRINPWGVVAPRATSRTYRLKKHAQKLFSILDLPAEEVFPMHLYDSGIPRDYAVEVDSIKFISLAEAREQKLLSSPETYEMDDPKDFEILYQVLKTLTPREEKIIRLRFGLDDDGKEKSLKEIGKEFGVSSPCIEQIEKKVMRRLKHPTRASKLRDLF